jgi:hypothetical protein
MTAEMPTTMPRMVSAERTLLFVTARKVSWNRS